MAHLTAGDLVDSGTLPPEVLGACVACMRDRHNVPVMSLARPGKITLIHALVGLLLLANVPLLDLDADDELRLERSRHQRILLRRDRFKRAPRGSALEALHSLARPKAR